MKIILYFYFEVYRAVDSVQTLISHLDIFISQVVYIFFMKYATFQLQDSDS